jgi:SAM-dependent methyltransferase
VNFVQVAKELCPPILWRSLKRVADPRGPGLYEHLSPEHFLDGWRVIEEAIQEYRQSRPPGRAPRFLDVGGRRGEWQGLAAGFEYYILDLEPWVEGSDLIRGDICRCPEIPDASYDVVFSASLLEHVREPWEAARSIGRILAPGGLAVTRTLFAWEYHEKPIDFWRYTHAALEFLFERYGGLVTVRSGYDVSRRWRNRGTDGFQEHWEVIHIGRKPR